jgi:hypothetical protein
MNFGRGESGPGVASELKLGSPCDGANPDVSQTLFVVTGVPGEEQDAACAQLRVTNERTTCERLRHRPGAFTLSP